MSVWATLPEETLSPERQVPLQYGNNSTRSSPINRFSSDSMATVPSPWAGRIDVLPVDFADRWDIFQIIRERQDKRKGVEE